MNYNDVCKIFSEKGCTIIDTESIFNAKKLLTKKNSIHHIRVNYIAFCGHINSVVITNFKLRGTGILCNQCIHNKTSLLMKEKGKQVTTIEYNGFVYIKNILSNKFNITKTPEGCEADILIQPIDNINDSWLKVQLKTTISKIHNMYSFNAVPYKYGNDIIYLFICEKDNKIWCIERNEISHLKSKLNISKNSKYNKYEHTTFSIISKLYDLYTKYSSIDKLCKLEKGISPKSVYQKREQTYIKLRETIFPDWEFKYNEIEALPYDFTVYGKRVQEKVSGSKTHNKAYTISLQRRKGNINGKRSMIPYSSSHFDILWIHIENTDIFYIIPMEELINYNYVNSENDICKKSLKLYIDKDDKWYSKFRFFYNNVNKDILLDIFKKNKTVPVGVEPTTS